MHKDVWNFQYCPDCPNYQQQKYKIYLSFLILEIYNFDSNQQATFSFYNQLFSITLSYFSQLSNWDGSQTVGTFPKKSNQLCQKKVNVRSWCHLFLALLTLIEFRQRPFHEIVFFSAWGNSCDSSQILNRWSGSYSALCLRPHNKRTVSIACLANFVASWLKWLQMSLYVSNKRYQLKSFEFI